VAIAHGISFAWRFFNGQGVTLPDGELRDIDFGYMWLSGNLAASGHAASAFDNSAFSAAQLALFGPDSRLRYFVHPPTYLLFTYPLGLMPYLIAFGVWMVATLMLYSAAVYAIIPRPAAVILAIPRPAAVILAITPSPAVFNIGPSHNGFLTAGLIGLSLVLIKRRPWLSGIFLGLLTCKPQLGVLLPLVLLVSRKWQVLAIAAATTITLSVVAAALFGYQTWDFFVNSLVDRDASLSEVPGLSIHLVSIFGFLQSGGVAERTSWTVHLTVALVTTAIVAIIWAKPVPHSLKSAALCIGSLMVTPYVLRYDLCVLSIAIAFLVEDGMSRGFLPGERTVMLWCWVGLVFLLVPWVPTIICISLLVLVTRRLFVSRRETLVTAYPVFRQ
jgi:alpha-1,2-mannosyltransferase